MDIEKAERLDLVAEYLKANPTPPQGGQHVHVHHHYPPAQDPSPPVPVNKGDQVLQKYTPYFVVMIGGVVVLAAVAVIFWLLASAIIAILLTILGCVAGITVLAAVLGSVLKTNRESLINKDLIDDLREGR